MATVNPSIHTNDDTASPAASKEKQALVAIRKLRKQLEDINYHQREPIAIVGLSCRFPGAPDADAFWRLLDEGVDATREVPPERWDADEYYDPDPEVPGKAYTRLAGFLDEIDQFDPAFFGISPREAEFMDPQQRILLEQAWCALEHAGIAPNSLQETRTGVFVGISACDYAMLIQEAGVDPGPYYITGNAFNAVAGRLAYTLKLQGPSIAIDTACSSSLVAAHEACVSLRNRESNLALVAGVNLIVSPMSMVATCSARMLSADGHCKTFDVSADGYARGEGCGVVVLKRLSDAQRDGDRIMATISGSAISHDGRSSGFTVPNGSSQQRAITDALRMADRKGNEVQYLEAHGTGTPLGDPIEIQAAARVLANDREGISPLLVGSVKTNIGHLESAAGVASLIKVTLAMQHGRIPRQLHCSEPNPHIPWDELDLRVATDPVPWPAGEIRRIAGISAFGFSGTNAHLIIEEAPDDPVADRIPEPQAEDTQRLLVLSGRTPGVLKQLGADFLSWLDLNGETSLDDVCYTAGTGRTHFEHRAAMVFTSSERLREQLTSLSTEDKAEGLIVGEVRSGKPKPKVGFLFTGQGAQYSGMGLKLYQAEKVYRDCFDRCASEFARLHGSGPGLNEIAHEEKYKELLTQTAYVQPALFALQVSLTALWRSWGVVPDALLGHSAGEYAAACAAGVFSVEEGMRLIVERARLMQTLPSGGAMLTVTAPADALEAVLEGDDTVCVSAYHGLNTVISGPSDRLDTLMKEFEGRNLYCTKLPASNAFHSKYVEPILDDFEAYAREIEYVEPSGTLVSSMTGSTIDGLNAAYWRNHARQPVRFADAVRTLFETAVCDVVVELGPQAELMWLAQMCWRPEHEVLWTSSLRQEQNGHEQMLTAAGQLYARGAMLDFEGIEGESLKFRNKVVLPTYPFQRQRYWIEGGGVNQRRLADLGRILYEINWKISVPESGDLNLFESRTWLIFGDSTGIAGDLRRHLQEMGSRVLLTGLPGDPAGIEECLAASINEAAADPACPLQGILYLWGLEDSQPESLPDLQAAQERGVLSALTLVQRLIRDGSEIKLWFVTQGAHRIIENDHVNATHSTLWGLGKSITILHPEIMGGMLDLPPGASSENLVEQVCQVLVAEDFEDHVALRQGQRWVARLRPTPHKAHPEKMSLHASGQYLITGGLGAIGLHIAKRMVARGTRHLVLTGRSKPDAVAMEAIKTMEAQGCEVKTLQVDVIHESDVSRLFEEILDTGMPRLMGIVHAAGIMDTVSIEDLSADRYIRVMAPKVWGAWLLDQEARSRKLDLSLFVCVSSMASIWGAQAHAHYSSANMFLDALMSSRQAEGLAGLSVNFGPWQGPGMGADEEARDLHKRIGVREIEPSLALDALELAICSSTSRLAVADVAWSIFKPLMEFNHQRPLLSEVGLTQGKVSTDDESPLPCDTHLELLRAAPESERTKLLVTIIRSEVAHVLKVEPETITEGTSVLELGMDSLTAVELISRLSKSLGNERFSPRLIYTHPTLSQLASAIAEQTDRSAAETSIDHQNNSGYVGEDHLQVKDGPLYTYRRYRAKDRKGIIASYGKAFGKDAARNLERIFDWKYLENPLNSDDGPVVDVLECDGKIVGMTGGIRVQFKIKNETVPGLWSVDSHVVDDHRAATGWFFRCVDENAPGLMLGIPNDTMYRYAAATESVIDLDQSIDLKASLGMGAILRTMGFNAFIAAIGELAFWPASKIFALVSRFRTESGISIQEIPRFDSNFDVLWQAVAPDYSGIMVRDQSFLSWRYDRCPNRDYTRYVAKRNGEIAGYMVTRNYEWKRTQRGLIVDYLVRRNDLAVLNSLIHRSMQDFRSRGLVSVRCPISSTQREHIREFRWHGFLFQKLGQHITAPRGHWEDSLASINDWFFTYGDNDSDYGSCDDEDEPTTP